MRKFFSKIHLWLSIPFGLIITVICLSGAVLVFESEIMQLVRPHLYRVDRVEGKPLPLGDLTAIAARELPDSVEVTGITVFSDPERTCQVNLSKPRRAALFIDPYTGEIRGRSERTVFFTFAFKTHRWLLDSMKPDGGIFWGKMIVGVSTLLFVFVLISGVVIWIPKTKRALKNRLKIAVNKGWRRFWFDLHVSAGIYATLLLLVMALTGLTWSFSWYRSGFYKLFGAEISQVSHGGDKRKATEERRHGGKPDEDGRSGHGFNRYAHWNDVYEKLALQNPDFDKITVSARSATVATKHWGNQRASDKYDFNPRSGEIVAASKYADSEKSAKLRGWIYSLHVGSWGGLFSKILTFLAALVGASLPLTGYYLWIKRLC